MIREEIRSSWDAYKKCAWGDDELKPLSCKGGRSRLLGRTSGTMIDAIDTLELVGLYEESTHVAQWLIDHSLVNRSVGQVSVFETTIRVLGGLLGAYTLHQERIYLHRAEEVGNALLAAFKGGVFRPAVNLKTRQISSDTEYTVAELGSLQIEFYELARLTGNRRFFDAACETHQWLLRRAMHTRPAYLMGTTISSDSMSFDRHMGGGTDSYYEYLLKLWHQGGRRQNELRDVYRKTSDALHRYLIKHKNGYAFVSKDWTIDHLTCFAPGMFALGSALMPDWKHASRDMETAKQLMKTCYRLYQTPAHVSCEKIRYVQHKFKVENPQNILRPEVAESLFILFRTTGDIKYREMSWNIFMRFRNSSRLASGGYSGLKDVSKRHSKRIDRMETFWIAETLKYLYLIQAPWDAFDLNRSVLSTEAHVFAVSEAMPLCKVPRRPPKWVRARTGTGTGAGAGAGSSDGRRWGGRADGLMLDDLRIRAFERAVLARVVVIVVVVGGGGGAIVGLALLLPAHLLPARRRRLGAGLLERARPMSRSRVGCDVRPEQALGHASAVRHRRLPRRSPRPSSLERRRTR
jgi:mannosyl-oligosaccharide alpha-1,2-mannosidase